jgi:chemotaxis protein CheC
MNLTPQQFDFLTEIINIGIGRSANVLNKIVKNRVMLRVPKIQLMKIDDLAQYIDPQSLNEMSLVSMGFKGDLLGSVALIFTSSNAVKMVDLLTDKNYEQLEMDQLRSSTLNEVGNIVLNSLIGTLGNLLKTRFRYSIPQFRECKSNEVLVRTSNSSEYLIYAETHFTIKNNNIEGSFMLFFEVGSLDAFIEKLDNYAL